MGFLERRGLLETRRVRDYIVARCCFLGSVEMDRKKLGYYSMKTICLYHINMDDSFIGPNGRRTCIVKDKNTGKVVCCRPDEMNKLCCYYYPIKIQTYEVLEE